MITVLTSDKTKLASYPLLLVANIPGGPSTSVQFTVNVIDSCSSSSIVTTSYIAS